MDTTNNKKILDLMYTSIKSEGGDGDALWLSKHTSLSDLVNIIEEYNKENNIDWEILLEDNCLLWGKEHEGAIITDSKDFFDAEPKYIILKINY